MPFQLMFLTSLRIPSQSALDLRNTWRPMQTSGICAAVETIYDKLWSEEPTGGKILTSIIPGTLVKTKSRRFPDLYVAAATSCSQPDRDAKSSAAWPWLFIGETEHNYSLWCAFRSPTKINENLLSILWTWAILDSKQS